MYVDLAFINCAELTAAAIDKSCFSCGKDKMLVVTAAALHTLWCGDGSVRGTAFVLWADKLQSGATLPELFPSQSRDARQR